jgi:PiT family inorganic phosphate transporter
MGETAFALIVFVVILSFLFDYINGFHDTANAIATVVSTNVLPPRTAVLMAGLFNFVGAFLGTQVAGTISSEIAPESVTQTVIAAALVGAIVWNLVTWYFGIPSSSSHALVGGLCGSIIAFRAFEHGFSWVDAAGSHGAFDVFGSKGVIKVLKGLVISPVAGLLVAFVIMIALMWLVRRQSPTRVNRGFRFMQLISSATMALSHGTNDAQKAMGIVTMALVSYAKLHPAEAGNWVDMSAGKPVVPAWVILGCASAMGCGTAAGGWRIMKTMGHKIIKLKPIHGFAAETAGAVVIQVASHFGAPVSTTHVISGAIMGVGASKRFSAVRWGIAGNILVAWVLTIPISCLVAALMYLILRPILGH